MKKIVAVVLWAAAIGASISAAAFTVAHMFPNLPPPPRIKTPVMIPAMVTAYAQGCPICDGKGWWRRKTATGKDARILDGVAADFCLFKRGTKLYIPGVGNRVVDDTGGAMRRDWRKKGKVHIDVRVNKHEEALKFGSRKIVIVKVS